MDYAPVNGELIEAQVEAIMSGNRRDIDRYLVRGVMVTHQAVTELPAQITAAIVTHQVDCPLVQRVDELSNERQQVRGRRALLAAVPNWSIALVALASLVVALIALVLHG